VTDLLEDEPRRLAMREQAAQYGRSMRWPAVAHRYMASFERARSEQTQRLRSSFHALTLAMRPAGLPEMNLEHLRLMTDNTGILQHATFSIPRYEAGYCLDDNARALLLMALLEDTGADAGVTLRVLASRYMAFVSHAFDRQSGRFRNLMSYGREWLEECGSEDSHGRSLWALGAVVGRSRDPGKRSLAGDLFHAALPAVASFTSPRAWAFALLGISEYLRAFQGDSNVQSVGKSLAGRLLDLFVRTSRPEWPWFEDRVTYSNARLPQALIVSSAWMEHREMLAAGKRSLAWLASIQTSKDGYFAPIGSNGFYDRGAPSAAFDQQPVEACGMVSACLDARRVTGEAHWTTEAARAFHWFLGQNHLQQSLYDPTTGGCRDGLHPERTNENQGAESTLSFLRALVEMQSVDRADVSNPVLLESTG
jgi:hypothetical protein